MAATAGFNGAVTVSTNDSAYNTVGLCVDAKFDIGREYIDITDYGDTSPVSLAGLKTASFTLEFLFDDTDTGQDQIRTACTDGSVLYVKVLPDGTNGAKCACLCEKISYSAEVKGVSKCTASFRANGAWSEV